MASKKLKDRILQFMAADTYNMPKNVDAFTILVANDYKDQDRPEYLFLIIDALCELEEEGKIADTYQYVSANASKMEKIKKSLWILNQ